VPLTQRKWVQAVMLSSALLGLAGLVYAFTRPPSAERLYRAVQIAAEAHDAEAVADASSRYLRLYGNRDDDATRQVRAWDRSFRTDRRVEQLHNRIYGKFKSKPNGETEKLAFKAIEQENNGDTDAAAQLWAELQERVKGASDPDEAVYGLVAEKKQSELAGVPVREKKLQDALDYEHALISSGRKPDLDLVGRACLDAFRLEQFGDLPAARDRWTAIRDENLKSLEDRGWAVLAAKRSRKMKELAVSGKEAEREFRRKLLTDKLAAAQAIPPTTDPDGKKQCVSICRDMIALYGRDPDPAVSAFGRKASQLLRDRGWS
jgi:hypothetical protein